MQNLQQLCIDLTQFDVSNEFMTSVSAHGGLVHVVMNVESLTAKGITYYQSIIAYKLSNANVAEGLYLVPVVHPQAKYYFCQFF